VGPGYYQTDVYRRQDFEAPSKILLVDDEKKYVQTLSKRLMMRELESAVVYDGESALELAREDEPDVMILDLRMPGIDGIEVLRRVKKTHPAIEVIVLTSQGSEADKKICMELGAFAFLSKSVDIDELSKTIEAANEKIRQRRARPEVRPDGSVKRSSDIGAPVCIEGKHFYEGGFTDLIFPRTIFSSTHTGGGCHGNGQHDKNSFGR
jgi:two-component system response regulator CpxR